MDIYKAYLNSRYDGFLNHITSSSWFSIWEGDIDTYPLLREFGFQMSRNEHVAVFQHSEARKYVPTFACIQYQERLAKDKETKWYIVSKLVVDYNAIDMDVFRRMFNILITQDSKLYDRITFGKLNERLCQGKRLLSEKLSNYLMEVLRNNENGNPIIVADEI